MGRLTLTLGVLNIMSGIFEATEPTAKNLARVREAFERLPDSELAACASAQPDTAKGFMANMILAERRAALAEQSAKLATDRQSELLIAIATPHWSQTPGFILLVLGTVASCIAAWYAYLSYAQQFQPSEPVLPFAQTSSSGAQRQASSPPPQIGSASSQGSPRKK